MASTTTKKLPCATCGKGAGLFTCRGCAKDFCMRHATEHRQTLGKEMDEVTLGHDQLRQTIAECTEEPRRHPLMKKIDEWEQESIDKIHQAANDARQKLLTVVGKHTTSVNETLEQFKKRLTKARDDEEFFETDLEEWKKKLNELKNELTAPATIKIRPNTNATPFISKIIVSIVPTDSFERLSGDIRVEDNGQLIVHGHKTAHAVVRGRGKYSSGQHRFRFKIERLRSSKWMSFGIVSIDAPMLADFWGTPTAYGWAGGNAVSLNGDCKYNYNDYVSDMEMNDTLELLVDCDRQMLRLTNERTGRTNELDVDVNKCSFPWQLNLSLYGDNDRLRILSP